MTSLHSIDAPLPDGFFVGEHARDFEDAVVGDAWNAPLEPSEGNQFLPWPCELSDETLQTLRLSALQVDSAMNNAGGQTDGRAGERASGQVGEPVGGEGAGRCENTGASLLRCAQLLVADSNLMPDMLGEASQDAFDSAVRAKGERILASGRQNVTSLQARAGMMDERGARTYWRGLVRPIPNVASPAAQLGTQFHAWAERFIMADANDAGIGVGASGNGGTRVAESRLAMLAELRRNNAAQSQDNQDDNGADNNGIFDWQQRLATSTWARRKRVGGTANRRQRAAIGHHRQRQARRGVLRGSRWGGSVETIYYCRLENWKKTSQKRGNSEKISTVGYVSYLAVGNGGRTAHRYRRLPLLSE